MSRWSNRPVGTDAVESRAPFTVVGMLALLIGLFFLLNPESPADPSLQRNLGSLGMDPPAVVNLQLLAIGQTLTIVGAIFLAFAWRPMRGDAS